MTPWLRRRAHRIFHPLAGADLGTLLAVLRQGGGVTPRHLHRVATALGSAAIRTPLEMLERRSVAHRAAEAAPVPPLFIIGHWRSGTTHLLNVLSRDPRFGVPTPLAVGLPWGFLNLTHFWRERLESWLPPDRIIDTIPVTPDAPQEDELALALMQPLSFYHGIFFPRHLQTAFHRGVLFEGCSPDLVANWRRCLTHYLLKLQLQQGRRRLLIKNPAHTARIVHLHALWPDAAFIHIHRNPYEVYSSTCRMLGILLREFALQSHDPEAVDRLVLDFYPRLIARFDADSATLPQGRLAEIRFEDFVIDPLGELARVYDALQLGAFKEAKPRFERYLADVRDYRRERHEISAQTKEHLRRHWGFAFDRWAYPSRV
jgi:hypothetical protein